VEHVKPIIDREYEQKNYGMISYAELMVALAFRYFSQRAVDYVALEAFRGGRYDATNVIEQVEVSILTNVGLDHTHILGDTVQEIASEKVGIMKHGCPFLTAEQRPDLLAMFREEAVKHQTTVEVLGEDFWVEQIATTVIGTSFDYISESQTFRKIQVPIPGRHQAQNAALAIRALEIVATNNHRSLDEAKVRDVLQNTRIPGRFEMVDKDPIVILDAAHNPDKMASLTTVLKRLYQPDEGVFVCAFTSGRDPQNMFKLMLEVSRTFYLTRAIVGFREDEEPLYLKHVLKEIEPDVQARIALDPFRAVELAMHEAKKRQKVVCVTGSAYLVGYVRQRWYPEHALLRYEEG
jgi:dihydrofolate synthase/folylpolyglutamate synthase